MKTCSRPSWPSVEGFSVLEFVLALGVGAAVVAAAVPFVRRAETAFAQIEDRSRRRASVTAEGLAASLRQAAIPDAPRTPPFTARREVAGPWRIHFFSGNAEGSPSDAESVVDGLNLRFFDGATWSPDWGWNRARNAAARGIRGLPLAVEIAGPGNSRVTVPVMTALLNRRRK